MSFIKKIKEYLFMLEVKHSGDFFIGGYNDTMVRINDRFLTDSQVKRVLDWRERGLIVRSRVNEITSTATGITYSTQLYKWKL